MTKKETPSENLKVAYLAPEIPALSATFVYSEILILMEQGVSVVPMSVHQPKTVARGERVDRLAEKTAYLYCQPFWKLITANLFQLVTAPLRYVGTVLALLCDLVRVGLFTRLAAGLIYRFWFSGYLAFFLKKKQCTHIHVHFAHVPTDLAMYASLLSGIPFSFTSHANDLFERGWLLKKKVERACFAVTISDYNRRFLLSQRALAEKINVIHCGVESEKFNLRQERKIGSMIRIGTLGRMVEKKGFDDLIAACRILEDKGVSFQLELAGDGPLKDRLKERADNLGIENAIHFKGALAHEAVPSWMQALDLFVLPCKVDSSGDMDGIPVVLMEAMMTGVPVVSTNISGIPELVRDGETGGLAQANHPQDLAETIIRICLDEALRRRICRQAEEIVRMKFDLNRNVDRLLSLFKEKCHGK